MSGMDLPMKIVMDVSGRTMSASEVEAASKHVAVVSGFNNVHHLARGSGVPSASQNVKSFPESGHCCGRAVKPQHKTHLSSYKNVFAAKKMIAKEPIVVNRHGFNGACKKVALSGTETVLDLFVNDGDMPATDRGFELFISPTMKRLDRNRTIRSYGIKDGANIYLLPVNIPKGFEPLEESLRKIRRMEHQQMIFDGLVVNAVDDSELSVDTAEAGALLVHGPTPPARDSKIAAVIAAKASVFAYNIVKKKYNYDMNNWMMVSKADHQSDNIKYDDDSDTDSDYY